MARGKQPATEPTSERPVSEPARSAAASNDDYIAIWAKAVETQMHFNEMSVKSRQLGLTFVAAALGVGVVLLSQGRDYSLPLNILGLHVEIHITVFLVLGALLALIAVKGLDLNVYHKMLRGAVTFGEDFEQNYMKRIFDLEKGMTQAISHFSRYQDARVVQGKHGCYTYQGNVKITAEDKIRRFYSNTIWFLCIFAAVLFMATNLTTWTGTNKSDAEKIFDRQTQTSP